MDETDPDRRSMKRKDSGRPAGLEAAADPTASYPSNTVLAALVPEPRGAWVDGRWALPPRVARVPFVIIVRPGATAVTGRAIAVAPHRDVATARLATHEAIHRIPVLLSSVFMARLSTTSTDPSNALSRSRSNAPADRTTVGTAAYTTRTS